MKSFKELIEAKQVGVIYHFTTKSSFTKMIKNKFKNLGLELFELFSLNGVVSCTRNFSLAEKPFGDISKACGHTVRINIDGDRLSNKYKIKPVLGYTDTHYPLLMDKNLERVLRSEEENEEMILTKGTNKTVKLKDYIISITISGDKEYYESIKNEVQKLGYEILYQRKFKPLKEDISYEIEESLYEVQGN